MSTMFYVVCIVIVVLVADGYNKYLKLGREKLKRDPQLQESLAKIESLEDRIRVLERIVTESKPDLSREIENLK